MSFEEIFQLWVHSVAILSCCRFSCTKATIREESPFERLVSLETYDSFQVLIDIARLMGCNMGSYRCIRINHPPFFSFFFVKFEDLIPKFFSPLCWTYQEGAISFVWFIVALDKVTNINGFRPNARDEIFPFSVLHSAPPIK